MKYQTIVDHVVSALLQSANPDIPDFREYLKSEDISPDELKDILLELIKEFLKSSDADWKINDTDALVSDQENILEPYINFRRSVANEFNRRLNAGRGRL